MLEADPVARASLDEVLAHQWMNPTPGLYSLIGAYKAAEATYAALRWPEMVERNLDDVWRNKNFAILELVAGLCEAPNTRRSTWDVSWAPVVPRLRTCAQLHWTSLLHTFKGRRQNNARLQHPRIPARLGAWYGCYKAMGLRERVRHSAPSSAKETNLTQPFC